MGPSPAPRANGSHRSSRTTELELLVIDPVDVYPPVIDESALDEIELTSVLMIVASESKRRLTQCEVDRILGVGSAT